MPAWVWLSFVTLVGLILAADLGLFHGDAHEVTLKESAILAGGSMTLGVAFSAVVWWLYYNGMATSLDETLRNAATASDRAWTAWQYYLTGWVVEQTLAFDNVFVMSMIFGYLAIPPKYQHRVLFYGILGVIVLRALMIGVGAALIQEFHAILFVFAAFLIFTGIKMLFAGEQSTDLDNNRLLNWLRRHMRLTSDIEGEKFFVQRQDVHTGQMARHATPLFLALVMIEFADLIFAVDSVPAIFSITTDPFIVYTSNIFAILGLRSLYFVLAAMVHRFHYLKYALALVLIYIGAKIFAQSFIGKISPSFSLVVTVSILVGGILFSLWKTRGDAHRASP